MTEATRSLVGLCSQSKYKFLVLLLPQAVAGLDLVKGSRRVTRLRSNFLRSCQRQQAKRKIEQSQFQHVLAQANRGSKVETLRTAACSSPGRRFLEYSDLQ